MSRIKKDRISSFAELQGIFGEVRRQFDEADFTPEMEAVEQGLVDSHRRHFAEGQTATGVAWPPLSPRTIARKGHAIPLYETGRLKASILDVGHPDHVRELLPDGRGLTFGTSVEYGIFHQDGIARIPQREFAGMNDRFISGLTEVVADSAVDAMAGRK